MTVVSKMSIMICRGLNRHSVVPKEFKQRNQRVLRTAVVFAPDFRSGNGFDWRVILPAWEILIAEICKRNDVVAAIDSDGRDVGEVGGLEDAPPKITFRRNGDLWCIMNTEYWCYCGGRYPYSDSYTFSFCTVRPSDDNAVFSAIRDFIERADIKLLDVLKEKEEPKWWWPLRNLAERLLKY